MNFTKKSISLCLTALALSCACSPLGGQTERLTDLVNPFVGTTTLWTPEDLGYVRTWDTRTWGGETFPGACLPNAMVQLTPVTQYRSGSGYQYEDSLLYGFAHTCKGHWNLLHLPVLPVTGMPGPLDYASGYRHARESARPGYYQVFLDRYGVDAELSATLRGGFHRYHFPAGAPRQVLFDITRTNHEVTDWHIEQTDPYTLTGWQTAKEKIYFYVRSSEPMDSLAVRALPQRYPSRTEGRAAGHWMGQQRPRRAIALACFPPAAAPDRPLELQIGFSFVSVENARRNWEAELRGQSFDHVCQAADAQWEALLGKIRVEGGTEKQRRMFYSCLFHAFKWPALRSDVNGEYLDARGQKARGDFAYYTDPSFWDDYRNKLVLLGMLSPRVTEDVIKSLIDKGEKSGGYMPTFFHGDHAAPFVSGAWLRGLRGFDLERAYRLLLQNANVPGRGGRRYLDEYLAQGWIAEKDTVNVPTWDEYKGAVTKTVEYAYDDYAVALVARELGDSLQYRRLMERSQNYKTLFDPSTGFWRGKIANGSWIQDFDPYYPYFQYMYREANAWQSLFFAPHDPEGMVALYPSPEAVEAKLDSLFTEPWRGYEAHNLTGFMGNYCHGNQPDHGVPYTYYFIGKQEKTQAVLDSLLDRYYGMGAEGLAYAGMDDAGEMSSWYVFNAIGLYTYSPADPTYLVTVPLFDKVTFHLPEGPFTLSKTGTGRKIRCIRANGEPLPGLQIPHSLLASGAGIVVEVE